MRSARHDGESSEQLFRGLPQRAVQAELEESSVSPLLEADTGGERRRRECRRNHARSTFRVLERVLAGATTSAVPFCEQPPPVTLPCGRAQMEVAVTVDSMSAGIKNRLDPVHRDSPTGGLG
jgi:hypothetical protein